jgi:hypothetical protein
MLNRSWIFRRACELAVWNRQYATQKRHPDFSRWLKMAWAEAKAGTLPDYSPVGLAVREVDTYERALIVAENAPTYDRNRVADLRHGLINARCALNMLRDAETILPSLAAE